MRTFLLILAAVIATTIAATAAHSEVTVYGIYRPLPLGEPNEVDQKDYYVSGGLRAGIRKGATLKVFRKTSTHDLLNRKLQADVEFPIAELKVIHSDENAAVARLVKLLPAEETPAISPRAVLVGDRVTTR